MLSQRVVVPEPVIENGTPGKVDDTSIEPVEKPLEVLDKPYLTELFEMGEAFKQFDMEHLTNDIDSFVKSEIERKGIKLSRDSYKEVIDEYLGKLKLPDDVSIYTKIEKLQSLMSINRKLLQAAKEKDEFFKMNPADMSSSQLKRYIEGI